MAKLFNHQVRFLIALLIVVIFGGFLWGFAGIALYIETGFMAILIGFLAGFVASLYFEKDNKWLYPTSATSFSLVGIFVGKYILFAYYELDALFVEPEHSKLNLTWKALTRINLSKLKAYSDYTAENFDFLDFFWALLALVTAQVNAMRVSRYKLAIYRFKQNLKKAIFN